MLFWIPIKRSLCVHVGAVAFESYVILDTYQTRPICFNDYEMFESYVILDTYQTFEKNLFNLSGFESYVILDTYQTFPISAY